MLEQSHIITLDYGQIHPRFSATKKEAKVITGIEFLDRKKNCDLESYSVDWFVL